MKRAILVVLCLVATSIGGASFSTCEISNLMFTTESTVRSCDVCGATWTEAIENPWNLATTTPVCSSSPYWSDDLDPGVSPRASNGCDAGGVRLCEHCAKYEPDFRAARIAVLKACREQEAQRIKAVRAAGKQKELDRIEAEMLNLSRAKNLLLACPNDVAAQASR
jgi:hypothetical protein